ncbi:hypothetical protein B0H14DRAFT_2967731 [Mycena olivaceomarginata]|nr:hypothetical protein B0H14DRAFT_2967731 [Mycena olivaceomarginata]
MENAVLLIFWTVYLGVPSAEVCRSHDRVFLHLLIMATTAYARAGNVVLNLRRKPRIAGHEREGGRGVGAGPSISPGTVGVS